MSLEGIIRVSTRQHMTVGPAASTTNVKIREKLGMPSVIMKTFGRKWG